MQGIRQPSVGLFFFAGKHKFGFNLQAVCDSENHFLEFWITHPASASDFIMFMLSDFNKKRQTPGFLASGLVLFGNTAYVSNATMATPYKRVKEGMITLCENKEPSGVINDSSDSCGTHSSGPYSSSRGTNPKDGGHDNCREACGDF